MVDVHCLSDGELQKQLKKLGLSPGPILPSTRKVYEKKLVQLLVPPPCAPPMLNGPRKLDGPKDSDDSEELNITLKGNLIFSTEKSKDSKKNPIFEIQEQQEDMVKPKSGYNNFKMLRKRPRAPATKTRALEACCMCWKPSKGKRCPARTWNHRIKSWTAPQEKQCCVGILSGMGSQFPVCLRLAILGIFLIVVFVYITVEKKSLFG
ncbi:LEM domain-containing protein 1 [Octodon degus]|uniref:LEM domain-containing protein 1 n=1 Tax=Octodon degus TaxID=10160 RepID=A0A6P6DBH5_OCTDE|nr:LEM domain-containing protein 1 [Octodon degus]XP_023556993.1 LEM domain-containing protein 1 [Octodon degus]